jgi:hypothetical protein
MSKFFKFALFFFLNMPLIVTPVDALNIPLEVYEALRLEGSGIDRTQEPLTVGIPLPEDSGITSINQLGLSGANVGQFRPLAYYKNGNIKWVLIDTQVNVPANGKNSSIALVGGRGNLGGSALASEDVNYININTGPAQFSIRKKGFNLFDKVIVGGQQIVNPGNSVGIRIVGMDDTVYLASNDSNIKISVEENGAVKAVVKAEGTHYSSGRKRMMDFTIRMFFYKNKTKARVSYTLRNASKNQVEVANIKSLDLITKLNLGSNIAVKIPKHDNSIIQSSLTSPSDNVLFYQGRSEFPQFSGCDGFSHKSPVPYYGEYVSVNGVQQWNWSYAQDGYWIRKNGVDLATGTGSQYHDYSFLDFSNSEGKGATVGIRFSSAYWPKSLRAKGDNTLEIGLYPEENNQINLQNWSFYTKWLSDLAFVKYGYWFRFGSHYTSDIMYDFHSVSTNSANEMKKFQYGLFGRAPVDAYNRSVQGIDPFYHFVSRSEEDRYASDNNWTNMTGYRQPGEVKIVKCYYWGTSALSNQHDVSRINLVNSWKEDKYSKLAGKYYLAAELWFKYNNDWAIRHSDDYDYEAELQNGWPIEPTVNRDKVYNLKTVFEAEHFHWYGLPLYYYASGEEGIKDSINDWGEYIKSLGRKLNFNFMRAVGWNFYSLAAMYDFTGDKEFMTIADSNFKTLLSRTNLGLSLNWERGFVAGGTGSGAYAVKPFMHSYIMYDGLLNYYKHLDDTNPLREKVKDLLDAMSDFTKNELIFGNNSSSFIKIYLPYLYYTNDPSNYAGAMGVKEVHNSYTQPYLFNGGKEWIELMKKSYRTTVLEGYGYTDHPGFQKMAYVLTHQKVDSTPPNQIANFKVLSENTCILNWDKPFDASGISKYQIKYSKKQIVENLNFDKSTQTYQFSPDNYISWWAANNIADEPSYEEASQYKIKNLAPGKYYFAVRAWDKSYNRGAISDLLQIEINNNGSCKQINPITQ